MKSAIFGTIAILYASIPILAANPVGDPPDFVHDVAPLLKKYCAGCHNGTDHEGDFSVESFAALQKGTGNGPAFFAGDAAGSRMIGVLTGGEPQMPPKDEPRPSADEITVLTRWIDAGAKGPDGAEPDRLLLVVPKIESHVERRPITAMAQAQDGTRLAVARYGEVAVFVNPSSSTDLGSPSLVLKHFPGKVNAVHFTEDGRRLITASGVEGLGGVAALWSAEDGALGALMREINCHRDTLYDAELSPDGVTLATCSYDKLIMLWNAETGEQLRTLAGHNGAVYDVAFSPDGRFLVSASADDTCKVWRVSDGERLDTLGQPLKEQYTCTFSPDGKTIVAGGADNRIRVWQFISTDAPRINPLLHARFAHEGAVLRVAFTADGARLVSLADDHTLKLWDTRDYSELQLWEKQPDIAVAVAIDEPSQTFRVGRLDGSTDAYPLTVASSEEHLAAVTAPIRAIVTEVDVPLTNAIEQEPNDTPAEATELQAPAVVTGLIQREGASAGDGAAPAHAAPDVDLFRFSSLADQEWVMEVNAARSESPLDSFIEVLTADGQRIDRVLLQAVRDSYFTFRGKDANQIGDFRIFNWQEMTLNEFLYCNGEVVKLWMYPRGPDSGYNVYPGEGTRWGYFDTTPLSHALGEPCFIVQPHPPGSEIIPNGLPVFTLHYENDDESRRTLGKDSSLTFTAPADGEYLIKLKDVRGSQGPNFNYTLTVRPRKPDFRVTIADRKLTIAPGSAKEFRVKVERLDGYEGPIQVVLASLPDGFAAPTSPLLIEAGQIEAMGVIAAHADAPTPSAEPSKAAVVTASARIGEHDVTHSIDTFEEIKLGEQPKLRAAILPAPGGAPPTASPSDGPLEFTIHPGETIMLKVAIERLNFDGEVSFGKEDSGRNLPHGLYVDNIGLNGLLLLSGQTEREFFITADDWVPEQSRLFHLTTSADGGHATMPVLLHVRHRDAANQQAAR